ncbi:C-type mannose receptor 2-like isoform X3 [Labeo rohita]|uniref:C-type mannose receptor 2-like isoform X3 n=1 Tax=Labeo rohita TaxID=84645 RepID=UPI0021E249E3|nr:C-type mannose receptor 2-like isoform X3 [Labeo rohita]
MCLSSAVVSSSLRQYHFVDQKKTWTEAQRYCRENHTDLVTINDMQEQNDIKQLLNSNSERVWIGLRSTDTWIWSLSDPASYRANESQYRNWSDNQPQGDGDCVYMDCGNGQKGQWHDAKCTEALHFICYNDKLVLIRENKTWTEALRHCRNNDMDLVSVDSEQMQQRVKMSITKANVSDHVWLGLRHSSVLGIWFWVNGQTVCYDQWAPDYNKDLNKCDTTVRTGAIRTSDNKWISRPETDTYNFICSK